MVRVRELAPGRVRRLGWGRWPTKEGRHRLVEFVAAFLLGCCVDTAVKYERSFEMYVIYLVYVCVFCV